MYDTSKLPGRPIYGTFTSADATTAAVFSLWENRQGLAAATAVVLGATETVWVKEILIVAAITQLITVGSGSTLTIASGEVFHECKSLTTASPQTFHRVFPVAVACQVGLVPKLKAGGTGQVDAFLVGSISSPANP